MPLKAFAEETSGAITTGMLFQSLGRFLARYGAQYYGYQIIATHLRRLNWDEGFVFNNLDPEFMTLVRARGYDKFALIATSAAYRQTPYFWSQVHTLIQLTSEQTEYLAFLKAYGFRDGVTVPIFGAKGGVALVAACSRVENLRIGPDDLLDLQLVCTFVHKRYLQLCGASEHEPPRLSKRELEVLGWIARGKSAGAIASILGVTGHTVDTLTRRAFRKLGVNDRISAVLKAVGAGLVTV